MPDSLADLITQSHGAAAADVYQRFAPPLAKLQVLASTGKDVLRHIPHLPGACAVMSAVRAARWQQLEEAPVYVVAGALVIGARSTFNSGWARKERDAARTRWFP